ncbi:RDD family protein [Legionella septentrionalis]|uniref:RDD family protein n=1 Tax=Legionella septentrionalis TaxID=2498109 RepID=A0A3S0VP33_9GAMM|nr:RDD family protein [Legionella septentrionalis]RUQ90411.1 RDD family protein [Legionella septentrionalis]RUR16489.1 RDD family protein [Legionella septentrionalis]
MFVFRYFASLFYDFIILSALFFIFTLCCIFLRSGHGIPPATLWYQTALLILAYSYYALSCRFGGQTIGMRAWNIKLIFLHGRFTHRQLITRLLLIIPAFSLRIIGFKKPDLLLQKWTKSQIISV